MKLYHATSIENMESIKENGLIPQTTTKISSENSRLLQDGIFGFVDLEDALSFGRDNWYYDDVVVFEFDADEAIDDPEYDGEAKFMIANEPVMATLVYSIE